MATRRCHQATWLALALAGCAGGPVSDFPVATSATGSSGGGAGRGELDAAASGGASEASNGGDATGVGEPCHGPHGDAGVEPFDGGPGEAGATGCEAADAGVDTATPDAGRPNAGT